MRINDLFRLQHQGWKYHMGLWCIFQSSCWGSCRHGWSWYQSCRWIDGIITFWQSQKSCECSQMHFIIWWKQRLELPCCCLVCCQVIWSGRISQRVPNIRYGTCLHLQRRCRWFDCYSSQYGHANAHSRRNVKFLWHLLWGSCSSYGRMNKLKKAMVWKFELLK